MVDHQVAHIYVKDGFANQAKQALEDMTGVDKLLYGEEKKLVNIDHERSGDIIAISDKDKWFSYYWWYESERAPSFASNVDIHRKISDEFSSIGDNNAKKTKMTLYSVDTV